MAIIRSKVLGLYVLDTSVGETDPFIVGVGADDASGITDAANNGGAVVGDKVILVTANGTFRKFVTVDSVTVGSIGGTEITNFNLALAATNTSMDISNTVNEIVARDGNGGSETYIVSGAQSWSFSADGFLTDSGNDSAHDIFTSSSGSKYVVVKFDTDVTNAASKTYVGQGLVESFSLSGGFDDNVTYSVTVNGYGKLYSYNA